MDDDRSTGDKANGEHGAQPSLQWALKQAPPSPGPGLPVSLGSSGLGQCPSQAHLPLQKSPDLGQDEEWGQLL
jgi:hypothetical protein